MNDGQVWHGFDQYRSLANIEEFMIEPCRKTTAKINVLDVITTNESGR